MLVYSIDARIDRFEIEPVVDRARIDRLIFDSCLLLACLSAGGLDQRMVTRALLESRVCSVANPAVWGRVGLRYSPWGDDACFHGSEEHQPTTLSSNRQLLRRGEMDPNWIRVNGTTRLRDVRDVLGLSNEVEDGSESAQNAEAPTGSEPERVNRLRARELHLISYASPTFWKSRERLAFEATRTAWFQNVTVFGSGDLPLAFKSRYFEILQNKRGGGYWVWRAQLFEQYLERLDEGDILVYVDAGCNVNFEGKERMMEYVRMVEQSPYDVLAFQGGEPENFYTTEHVFKFFNVSANNSAVYDTMQYAAGILIMQKGPHLRTVLAMVRHALEFDAWLFSDRYNAENVLLNPAFRDARHDQSILSVVLKLVGSVVLKDETYWPTPRAYYPFWASRIKP